MTADTSPDWLPAGWAREYKFLKTGRRITHYVNLATGQKFFTKDDLIRHSNTGITRCDDQRPTLKQIKMPSANGRINTAAKANEHPDWLPKDWLMEVKTRTSGRPYKIYVDPSTGRRFYSKPEVLGFLKTVKQKSSKSRRKKKASPSTSKVGGSPIVVKANERPEWLPKDWFVEVKAHKSGSTIGRTYKVYVDPSTGFKFYSKPEVFRFLKIVEQESGKSKPKQRASPSTSEITVKPNEHPEWLPEDWFMEVKVQKSGAKIGKKYRVYVDPLTGTKFLSKPEVLQFLNHAERKSSKSKQKKNSSCPTTKVVIRRSKAEDLPAGWIKELKIRRNANGVREDPSYIDPASGCTFRSKKAVLRYLETGEIHRDSSLTKKHSDDKKLIDEDKSQLPAAKRQKVKHPATRRQLFKGEETSDGSILSDLEPETSEKGHNKKGYIETELPTASVRQIPQRKGVVENAIKRNPETAEKSNWNSSVAPKASKRKQVKIASAGNVLVSTAAADVLQVNLLECGTEKRSNMDPKNSEKSKNKTELDLPHGFPNQLAQFEPELVAIGLEPGKPCQNVANSSCVFKDEAQLQLNIHSYSEVTKQASAYSTSKSKRGSLKPTEDKDTLGKQPQMLETEKSSEARSEVQPPFRSEPYPEFTIKTPRGAVPLENAGNDRFDSTPASNVLQEKNLRKTRIKSRRSNIETNSSSKSKKMKRLDLPRRRSPKPLARHEPELLTDRVPTQVAFQNVTSEPGKIEPKTPFILVDKAAQQLNTGPYTKLSSQASSAAVNLEFNKVSPHEDRTILGRRSDSKSELQPLFSSDPCLEFAIKTLTGALPLEDAINEGLVSTSNAKIEREKKVVENRIENSSFRTTLFNSVGPKKKDCSVLQWSSTQLAGHAPETGPRMTIEGYNLTSRTTVSHVEPPNNNKEPPQNQTVSTEMNTLKPGVQSAITFGSSWSDPSFGFAFKTVTGYCPPEDGFAFRSNFHQQFGSSCTQRAANSAPPDYGFSNVFQSDISSHLNAMAPVMQQQFPMNPLFSPSENVSLPSSTRVDAQPYKKGKGKNQAK